jgi:GNAT superfamily N-acetyltransferase
MSDPLTLRLMREEEAHELLAWAAAEGWNPGLHDASAFWAADPEAFIAAELEGRLVGGGAITSYDGEFGFMGLFIVRPEHRRQGLGSRLWHARVQLLRGRLRAGATIGLDGVEAMARWYAEGGFVASHRTIRYRALGVAGGTAEGVVPAARVPYASIAAYDRRCFPAPRERFLQAWLTQPDALALAVSDRGRLRGYGVVRRCRVGAKIGPLFADDAETAERLYTSLAAFAPGEQVVIDVPEVNAWAMALARRHRMGVDFSVVRMYLGGAPRLDEARIFGTTTFELG